MDEERASEASEQAEIKSRFDAYRAAMRLSIINAGGIAEPRVSDSFLIQHVPAEMLALRRLYISYRAAMRQLMEKMEGGAIAASISDAELLDYAKQYLRDADELLRQRMARVNEIVRAINKLERALK